MIVEIEGKSRDQNLHNSSTCWRVRVTDDDGTGRWGASMWNCDLWTAIEQAAVAALTIADAERAEAATATIEP